jgi:competence protein ComEC
MNKKTFFTLLILFFCNVIAFNFVFNRNDNLRVIFFDIGQGDSIFIETSQGHQILVDGGPNNSVLNNLEKFMSPFDKSIDMIILTHADKDHLAGLVSVLKVYNVDIIVSSP